MDKTVEMTSHTFISIAPPLLTTRVKAQNTLLRV